MLAWADKKQQDGLLVSGSVQNGEGASVTDVQNVGGQVCHLAGSHRHRDYSERPERWVLICENQGVAQGRTGHLGRLLVLHHRRLHPQELVQVTRWSF